VRAAPAQVAVQGGPDLLIGWIGVAPEQAGRRDDHAGQAVAALGTLSRDERPRDRMRLVRASQPFDRDDFLALHGPQRRVARVGGQAVHQHQARPAQAKPAAEPGPFQAEVIPQDV
jgi:hypothetical protein